MFTVPFDMYWLTFLSLASLGLVSSLPIRHSDLKNETDYEVIYVPYDVKYVPVEVPINVNDVKKSNTFKLDENVGSLANQEILKNVFAESKANILPKIAYKSTDLQRDSTSAVSNFSDSTDPEGIILIPLTASNIPGGEHQIVKRQAPGNIVVRPVVTYRRLLRRISRPPAFVGYLNDNDDFPTVAV
ncbi:uncharacterized protein LOC132706495 [Cylas formicarius]|uniref:uncharacterized protein LOC132706495 n=1 Tax=Cylas formicarius TaxID=197179 RepID=UPI0029584C97|nr:uncharacterized protein LOC132706495 [Cylas formicarius]